MPPAAQRRSYTSAGAPGATDETEVVSTEGMTFDLDGVTFTCHGAIDANDLIDLAPLLDADENWFDPAALGAVGTFYEQMMGTASYRALQRHRRARRTRPSVIAQIMFDLIEAAMNRPPDRSSSSPPGPPPTAASSPAGSPPGGSPGEGEARSMRSPAAGGRVDPEGIIPPEMAHLADVELAEAPPAGGAPEPAALPHRVINLGDGARTRLETAQA
jgi:hypothetical protein